MWTVTNIVALQVANTFEYVYLPQNLGDDIYPADGDNPLGNCVNMLDERPPVFRGYSERNLEKLANQL